MLIQLHEPQTVEQRPLVGDTRGEMPLVSGSTNSPYSLTTSSISGREPRTFFATASTFSARISGAAHTNFVTSVSLACCVASNGCGWGLGGRAAGEAHEYVLAA